jgi:hypothetical protein
MAFLALLLVGCGGGSPANVAGTYTINLTNRDNGCMLQNWVAGEQTTGVMGQMTQSDENASMTVMGLAGLALNAWLGSNVFSGTVDGNDVNLTILGSKSYTTGNCTYTYNALIDGSISGDTLSGRIVYTAATNDNPDCAALDGCSSYQDFNAIRPPAP